MTEIEIRAKIGSVKATEDKITILGAILISRHQQLDKIFGRAEDLDKDHKIIEGHYSARIRQQEQEVSMEFKEIKRTGIGRELSAQLEKISDGEHFLKQMGFNEAFAIDKMRAKYAMGSFEIFLDEVKDLGGFIEIEFKSPGEISDQKALKQCKDILKQIDSKAVEESRKYGDLMQELINKRKKDK